jgi:hypothetical protein
MKPAREDFCVDGVLMAIVSENEKMTIKAILYH